MNNPNNSNRVVINLDSGLDELDDDDITLPSLPVQSVPIIDAPERNGVSNSNEPVTPTVNKQVSSTDAAESIALGAPILMTQKQIHTDNTSESFANTNDTENTTPAVSASKIPTMPLQAQLGDLPSVTPSNASSINSSSNQASSEPQQTIPVESQANKALQEEQESSKKGSWFNRMKTGLSKSRKNLAEGMVSILIGGKEIDDELLEEVEDQLLVADIGVNATNRIIKSLTEQTDRGDLIYAHSLYKALQTELVDILTPKVAPLIIDSSKKPFVILVVGVNGVGKTTTIGKLAKRLQGEGKSVMLAAGDTFRAAATEQLQIWGERNHIPVVAQGHGSDSASVIFDAMQSAKAKNIDVLIADTAGRLQNKTHLMAELEKVVRVMRKADPSAPHEGMIVLDAGTGQNAINQVELFNKVVPLTGITITKLDGTAKGGVVFNIAETTDVPIRYIGVGESIDDLRAFSPKQFVAALFETDDKE
ncbi:signal recognition particle-docking protein FtsY [Psychrobacter cryohalolentis]|uniref:Signal recognition particle receptor FtsY n=1 Tax=Psychrobacter cryohalolentis (strain ATCC BAA-1226 / DSM 17306 / VKM B-2378 / K5) TaxID=335284 RepID=Q1QAP3_PSYCK|nr:signal recognition particle-docking protein FtsY [Psychrobacter cryohalolentis K5]ASE25454.1 signal recognition particle-docking protein FtsY [Psychrobacter cryohalolentis]